MTSSRMSSCCMTLPVMARSVLRLKNIVYCNENDEQLFLQYRDSLKRYRDSVEEISSVFCLIRLHSLLSARACRQ